MSTFRPLSAVQRAHEAIWALVLVCCVSGGATAQVGILGHACMDCHLRDHDVATGVPEEMRRSPSGEGRLQIDMSQMFDDLSPSSGRCMECHSTPERRIDRAWEQRERSVPLTDGKFLDVNLSDDHPVEGARRSSLWRRSLVGRLGRSSGGLPVETADRLVHDAPPAECSACHDPHSYSDATSDPSSVRSLCLSCHDPTYYALDEHITPSCVDCHVMHAAPGDDLLRSREPEDTCGACHLGTVSFGTVTVDPALRGPPGHDDVRTDRCVDCHQVHARGG